MDVKKVAAKKPVKKGVQAIMVEAARTVIKTNEVSLCSWVQWNTGSKEPKMIKGDICYASFRNQSGISEARITVRPRDLAQCDKEYAIPYWKWLINESFWSKCFIGKDVRNGLKNGFRMNMDQPFMLVHGAAIAIRQCWEHKASMRTWKVLVDKGVDPHIAHACTHVFSHVRDNLFISLTLCGHALFNGAGIDPIKYRTHTTNKDNKLATKAKEIAGSYGGNFALFCETQGESYMDSKFYKWCRSIKPTRVNMGNYIVMDDALIERIKKEEWNV